MQFPPCDDENKMSVSCLNLHYSIKTKKTRSTTVRKDELTDPFVLVEFGGGEHTSPTVVSMLSVCVRFCKNYNYYSDSEIRLKRPTWSFFYPFFGVLHTIILSDTSLAAMYICSSRDWV